MARPVPEAEGDATPPASRVRVRTGTAIGLTGLVGGMLFALLILASASVYEAVAADDGVAGLDRPVLDAMIRLRTPLSETVVTAFTQLGTTVPMVVIGLVLMGALYLTYRRRTIIVLMLVAAAGSITFTIVGKAWVGRSRPPLVDAVPPFEESFSFPSGHTLNSTVVAGMLAYLVVWLADRAWQRVCAVLGAVLWALAMGLSRVFLGHHWLTDVVFAWLFGLAWLALLITVHRIFLDRHARRLTG
ncbi:MAG: phosphatase PAP2 family protein [Propionicimonas sp.]|uniref:phosphatase PAP2 family protein n=1 Tax=Propionicimonas sp. TaxID=1955623 RepID=UPI003D10FB6F